MAQMIHVSPRSSRGPGMHTPSPPPASVGDISGLPSIVASFCASLPPVPAWAGDAALDPVFSEAEQGYDLPFMATDGNGTSATMLDQDLVCVVCSLVCREAVETSCSHIFCGSCIRTWLRQKAECATCRSPLSPSGVHSSGYIRRKVLSLRVRCIHVAEGEGCTWTGELRDLSRHLRGPGGCAFQRLVHATSHFVESAPSSSSDPESSHASAQLRATTLLAFPRAIIAALPPVALARLSSFHTLHALSASSDVRRLPQAHPAFSLANSCVMLSHREDHLRSDLTHASDALDLFCGPTHACSDSCRPAGSEQDHPVERFHALLAACRAQWEQQWRGMSTYFASAPVKVLQAFLASKELSSLERERTRGALEKAELVFQCMLHRNVPDSPAYRRSGPGRSGAKHRDDPLRDMLGMNEEDVHAMHAQRHHLDAALLANQMHAAALGRHPHEQHHLQHHALHAAHHMALGLGVSLNLQGAQGVVFSMHVQHPSGGDDGNDPAVRFAQAMAQHHLAHQAASGYGSSSPEDEDEYADDVRSQARDAARAAVLRAEERARQDRARQRAEAEARERQRQREPWSASPSVYAFNSASPGPGGLGNDPPLRLFTPRLNAEDSVPSSAAASSSPASSAPHGRASPSRTEARRTPSPLERRRREEERRQEQERSNAAYAAQHGGLPAPGKPTACCAIM